MSRRAIRSVVSTSAPVTYDDASQIPLTQSQPQAHSGSAVDSSQALDIASQYTQTQVPYTQAGATQQTQCTQQQTQSSGESYIDDDGNTVIISYRVNEQGKKVRVKKILKKVVKKKTVDDGLLTQTDLSLNETQAQATKMSVKLHAADTDSTNPSHKSPGKSVGGELPSANNAAQDTTKATPISQSISRPASPLAAHHTPATSSSVTCSSAVSASAPPSRPLAAAPAASTAVPTTNTSTAPAFGHTDAIAAAASAPVAEASNASAVPTIPSTAHIVVAAGTDPATGSFCKAKATTTSPASLTHSAGTTDTVRDAANTLQGAQNTNSAAHASIETTITAAITSDADTNNAPVTATTPDAVAAVTTTPAPGSDAVVASGAVDAASGAATAATDAVAEASTTSVPASAAVPSALAADAAVCSPSRTAVDMPVMTGIEGVDTAVDVAADVVHAAACAAVGDVGTTASVDAGLVERAEDVVCDVQTMDVSDGYAAAHSTTVATDTVLPIAVTTVAAATAADTTGYDDTSATVVAAEADVDISVAGDPVIEAAAIDVDGSADHANSIAVAVAVTVAVDFDSATDAETVVSEDTVGNAPVEAPVAIVADEAVATTVDATVISPVNTEASSSPMTDDISHVVEAIATIMEMCTSLPGAPLESEPEAHAAIVTDAETDEVNGEEVGVDSNGLATESVMSDGDCTHNGEAERGGVAVSEVDVTAGAVATASIPAAAAGADVATHAIGTALHTVDGVAVHTVDGALDIEEGTDTIDDVSVGAGASAGVLPTEIAAAWEEGGSHNNCDSHDQDSVEQQPVPAAAPGECEEEGESAALAEVAEDTLAATQVLTQWHSTQASATQLPPTQILPAHHSPAPRPLARAPADTRVPSSPPPHAPLAHSPSSSLSLPLLGSQRALTQPQMTQHSQTDHQPHQPQYLLDQSPAMHSQHQSPSQRLSVQRTSAECTPKRLTPGPQSITQHSSTPHTQHTPAQHPHTQLSSTQVLSSPLTSMQHSPTPRSPRQLPHSQHTFTERSHTEHSPIKPTHTQHSSTLLPPTQPLTAALSITEPVPLTEQLLPGPLTTVDVLPAELPTTPLPSTQSHSSELLPTQVLPTQVLSPSATQPLPRPLAPAPARGLSACCSPPSPSYPAAASASSASARSLSLPLPMLSSLSRISHATHAQRALQTQLPLSRSQTQSCSFAATASPSPPSRLPSTDYRSIVESNTPIDTATTIGTTDGSLPMRNDCVDVATDGVDARNDSGVTISATVDTIKHADSHAPAPTASGATSALLNTATAATVPVASAPLVGTHAEDEVTTSGPGSTIEPPAATEGADVVTAQSLPLDTPAAADGSVSADTMDMGGADDYCVDGDAASTGFGPAVAIDEDVTTSVVYVTAVDDTDTNAIEVYVDHGASCAGVGVVMADAAVTGEDSDIAPTQVLSQWASPLSTLKRLTSYVASSPLPSLAVEEMPTRGEVVGELVADVAIPAADCAAAAGASTDATTHDSVAADCGSADGVVTSAGEDSGGDSDSAPSVEGEAAEHMAVEEEDDEEDGITLDCYSVDPACVSVPAIAPCTNATAPSSHSGAAAVTMAAAAVTGAPTSTRLTPIGATESTALVAAHTTTDLAHAVDDGADVGGVGASDDSAGCSGAIEGILGASRVDEAAAEPVGGLLIAVSAPEMARAASMAAETPMATRTPYTPADAHARATITPHTPAHASAAPAADAAEALVLVDVAVASEGDTLTHVQPSPPSPLAVTSPSSLSAAAADAQTNAEASVAEMAVANVTVISMSAPTLVPTPERTPKSISPATYTETSAHTRAGSDSQTPRSAPLSPTTHAHTLLHPQACADTLVQTHTQVQANTHAYAHAHTHVIEVTTSTHTFPLSTSSPSPATAAASPTRHAPVQAECADSALTEAADGGSAANDDDSEGCCGGVSVDSDGHTSVSGEDTASLGATSPARDAATTAMVGVDTAAAAAPIATATIDASAIESAVTATTATITTTLTADRTDIHVFAPTIANAEIAASPCLAAHLEADGQDAQTGVSACEDECAGGSSGAAVGVMDETDGMHDHDVEIIEVSGRVDVEGGVIGGDDSDGVDADGNGSNTGIDTDTNAAVSASPSTAASAIVLVSGTDAIPDSAKSTSTSSPRNMTSHTAAFTVTSNASTAVPAPIASSSYLPPTTSLSAAAAAITPMVIPSAPMRARARLYAANNASKAHISLGKTNAALATTAVPAAAAVGTAIITTTTAPAASSTPREPPQVLPLRRLLPPPQSKRAHLLVKTAHTCPRTQNTGTGASGSAGDNEEAGSRDEGGLAAPGSEDGDDAEMRVLAREEDEWHRHSQDTLTSLYAQRARTEDSHDQEFSENAGYDGYGRGFARDSASEGHDDDSDGGHGRRKEQARALLAASQLPGYGCGIALVASMNEEDEEEEQERPAYDAREEEKDREARVSAPSSPQPHAHASSAAPSPASSHLSPLCIIDNMRCDADASQRSHRGGGGSKEHHHGATSTRDTANTASSSAVVSASASRAGVASRSTVLARARRAPLLLISSQYTGSSSSNATSSAKQGSDGSVQATNGVGAKLSHSPDGDHAQGSASIHTAREYSGSRPYAGEGITGHSQSPSSSPVERLIPRVSMHGAHTPTDRSSGAGRGMGVPAVTHRQRLPLPILLPRTSTSKQLMLPVVRDAAGQSVGAGASHDAVKRARSEESVEAKGETRADVCGWDAAGVDSNSKSNVVLVSVLPHGDDVAVTITPTANTSAASTATATAGPGVDAVSHERKKRRVTSGPHTNANITSASAPAGASASQNNTADPVQVGTFGRHAPATRAGDREPSVSSVATVQERRMRLLAGISGGSRGGGDMTGSGSGVGSDVEDEEGADVHIPGRLRSGGRTGLRSGPRSVSEMRGKTVRTVALGKNFPASRSSVAEVITTSGGVPGSGADSRNASDDVAHAAAAGSNTTNQASDNTAAPSIGGAAGAWMDAAAIKALIDTAVTNTIQQLARTLPAITTANAAAFAAGATGTATGTAASQHQRPSQRQRPQQPQNGRHQPSTGAYAALPRPPSSLLAHAPVNSVTINRAVLPAVLPHELRTAAGMGEKQQAFEEMAARERRIEREIAALGAEAYMDGVVKGSSGGFGGMEGGVGDGEDGTPGEIDDDANCNNSDNEGTTASHPHSRARASSSLATPSTAVSGPATAMSRKRRRAGEEEDVDNNSDTGSDNNSEGEGYAEDLSVDMELIGEGDSYVDDVDGENVNQAHGTAGRGDGAGVSMEAVLSRLSRMEDMLATLTAAIQRNTQPQAQALPQTHAHAEKQEQTPLLTDAEPTNEGVEGEGSATLPLLPPPEVAAPVRARAQTDAGANSSGSGNDSGTGTSGRGNGSGSATSGSGAGSFSGGGRPGASVLPMRTTSRNMHIHTQSSSSSATASSGSSSSSSTASLTSHPRNNFNIGSLPFIAHAPTDDKNTPAAAATTAPAASEVAQVTHDSDDSLAAHLPPSLRYHHDVVLMRGPSHTHRPGHSDGLSAGTSRGGSTADTGVNSSTAVEADIVTIPVHAHTHFTQAIPISSPLPSSSSPLSASFSPTSRTPPAFTGRVSAPLAAFSPAVARISHSLSSLSSSSSSAVYASTTASEYTSASAADHSSYVRAQPVSIAVATVGNTVMRVPSRAVLPTSGAEVRGSVRDSRSRSGTGDVGGADISAQDDGDPNSSASTSLAIVSTYPTHAPHSTHTPTRHSRAPLPPPPLSQPRKQQPLFSPFSQARRHASPSFARISGHSGSGHSANDRILHVSPLSGQESGIRQTTRRVAVDWSSLRQIPTDIDAEADVDRAADTLVADVDGAGMQQHMQRKRGRGNLGEESADEAAPARGDGDHEDETEEEPSHKYANTTVKRARCSGDDAATAPPLDENGGDGGDAATQNQSNGTSSTRGRMSGRGDVVSGRAADTTSPSLLSPFSPPFSPHIRTHPRTQPRAHAHPPSCSPLTSLPTLQERDAPTPHAAVAVVRSGTSTPCVQINKRHVTTMTNTTNPDSGAVMATSHTHHAHHSRFPSASNTSHVLRSATATPHASHGVDYTYSTTTAEIDDENASANATPTVHSSHGHTQILTMPAVVFTTPTTRGHAGMGAVGVGARVGTGTSQGRGTIAMSGGRRGSARMYSGGSGTAAGVGMGTSAGMGTHVGDNAASPFTTHSQPLSPPLSTRARHSTLTFASAFSPALAQTPAGMAINTQAAAAGADVETLRLQLLLRERQLAAMQREIEAAKKEKRDFLDLMARMSEGAGDAAVVQNNKEDSVRDGGASDRDSANDCGNTVGGVGGGERHTDVGNHTAGGGVKRKHPTDEPSASKTMTASGKNTDSDISDLSRKYRRLSGSYGDNDEDDEDSTTATTTDDAGTSAGRGGTKQGVRMRGGASTDVSATCALEPDGIMQEDGEDGAEAVELTQKFDDEFD